MKHLSLPILLVAATSIGCITPTDSPHKNVPAERMSTEYRHGVLLTEDTTHLPHGSASAGAILTKDDAKKISDAYTQQQNLNWGQAKSVAADSNKAFVTYDTPEHENRLSGPRMVIVDRISGSASVVKRR